jgi:hypothetical protein
MEVKGQLHTPAALPPGKRAPDTHWIGGWVGPRAVLDAEVKRKIPSPRRELNPRTHQRNFSEVRLLYKKRSLKKQGFYENFIKMKITESPSSTRWHCSIKIRSFQGLHE